MKPFKSPKYRKWLKSQPCACECGKKAEVAAHQNLDGGTTAGEASDLYCLPMSDVCHKQEHTGRLTFWENVLWFPPGENSLTIKKYIDGLIAIRCLKLLDRYLAEGNKF